MQPLHADADVEELRRCVRDLAALAALPLVWASGDGSRVVESLAEAVLGMLRLEFIYISLRRPSGATELEFGRIASRPSRGNDVDALGNVLRDWLANPAGPVPAVPGCREALRGARVSFGFDGSSGVIAAGCAREGFPTETDRLLLQVAANQAALILSRHRSESERERLLREVNSQRERLADVFHNTPAFLCVLSGPDHVFELANEKYLELVGRPVVGLKLAEALPEVSAQGFLQLLDDVFRTGETYTGHDVPVHLRGPDGLLHLRYVDFSYQAMRAADGTVTGVLVQGIDLTERKRADEALRAKDARLHLLLDNMQEYAVVITDREGLVIEWAAGSEKITGYAAADAIGQSIDTLLCTDSDRASGHGAQERHAALRAGKVEDRRWHLRSDGDVFFADGVMAPLYDGTGALHGFGKVFRDVTLEWQARQELTRVTEESDRRKRLYETFLGNTPDLAYVFDLEHRFTYANEALLKMWGLGWDEAIGKTCLELGYEPWHAEMHDREIEQVKSTRRPVRGEVPFSGTYGRRIYDYIFVPVLGPDGQVEAVAGTTRDVTERKQSELELSRLLGAEQRRANLLERVAKASRVLNNVLSVDAICEVLTEEARNLIGARRAMTSLAEGGHRAEAGEAADAVVPMLAVPLVGHGGRILGRVEIEDKAEGDFTAEDRAILEQLAAIAAVGIENARLYESVRDQDRRKDEFLAILAHELRNPLAPLRTGLDVLSATGESNPVALRTREMMQRQVRHMVRLIDDLLDVSRISRGKLTLQRERLSVASVFASALETSRPLLDAAGLDFTVIPPDPGLHVNGDATRLGQVLSNLLNNAAKYTPAGGRVELSARGEGGKVAITVRDTGIGIPRDMLPKVFDLFTQVGRNIEHAQGGLGIGLALARKLVEMHEGTIGAESGGPGHGCTVTVTLPLAGHVEEGADAPQPEAGAPRSTGLRVLVVDDNVDAAETFAFILDLSGHEARTANSGQEGIAAAGVFLPHVIFLDIGLPDVSGYRVALSLRADPRFAQATIVALTGWGSEADRLRSKEAGFDHHLTKPVETGAVQKILADVAASRKAAGPAESPHRIPLEQGE